MQPSEITNNVNGVPTPSQQPPPEMRLADPDAYVERNIRGVREFVPVKALVNENQTFEAGKQMLDEARQLRHQNAQALAEAEQHRTLMAQLSNPVTAPMALAGLTRIAERQGVDVNALIAQMSATPGGTNPSQQVASTATPQDPHTKDLDARLRRFEDREQQAAFDTRVGDVMATYFPGVDTSTERGKQFAALARQQVMAAQIAQPEKPLEQCAREVHQSFVDAGLVTSLQRTAVRDQRREAAQNPAVSPNLGAAPTANPVKSDVGNDALNSGRFKAGMAAFLRGAHAALGPNPSAP